MTTVLCSRRSAFTSCKFFIRKLSQKYMGNEKVDLGNGKYVFCARRFRIKTESLLSPKANVYRWCEKKYLSTTSSDGAVNENWKLPEGHDTGIQIYNPLTKSVTPLIVHNKGQMTWYSCGPTVYDSAHIGHASSYVRLDIMRRIIEDVFGLNVSIVMGITDIDDKIIKRANENGEDFKKITKHFENEFFQDMDSLNVASPSYVTRVTQFVPDIIAFIQVIILKGLAYSTPSGSVYFDLQKYGKSGKFHGMQANDESEAIDIEKKNPQDFALWKAVKPKEPSWDSPWGPGRPGWHIECSVMAGSVFGKQLDIHTGGQDLKFPHHENELSQSNAFFDCEQWVNYWIHTGHLFLKDGADKMSKSLKNGISVNELLQSYSPNHFRMLCLLSHYRNEVEYCDEVMNKAVSVYQVIMDCMSKCDAYVMGQYDCEPFSESEIFNSLDRTKNLVKIAFAEDFHTSKAMDAVQEHVGILNSALGRPCKTSQLRSPVPIAASKVYLERLLRDLGFSISSKSNMQAEITQNMFLSVMDAVTKFRGDVRTFALNPKTEDGSNIKQLKKQHRALTAPLMSACDNLRDELSYSGVVIKDHGDKATWSLPIEKKKSDE